MHRTNRVLLGKLHIHTHTHSTVYCTDKHNNDHWPKTTNGEVNHHAFVMGFQQAVTVYSTSILIAYFLWFSVEKTFVFSSAIHEPKGYNIKNYNFLFCVGVNTWSQVSERHGLRAFESREC